MVSSNFSPDPRSVCGFLIRSLRLLEKECPEAYAGMCETLASREIALDLAGEPIMALQFEARTVRALAQPRRPNLHLQTNRQTILDLVQGRATLLQAILRNDLMLRGDVMALADFHAAFLLYVAGAVRSPSFPLLLRRFELGEQA